MIKIKNDVEPIYNVCSSSTYVSYLRTVQITHGIYPFPDKLNNIIIEIKNNLDKDLSNATNVKGGMTDWIYFLDHPLFNEFLNYFINQNQLSNSFLQRFDEKREVMNAWGNELKKDQYVQPHTHITYHGILYLTKGNPLILPELNMEIHPEPGEYYLFPPEILHYVEPVKEEDKPRYNLIFNIGNKDTFVRDKKISETLSQKTNKD